MLRVRDEIKRKAEKVIVLISFQSSKTDTHPRYSLLGLLSELKIKLRIWITLQVRLSVAALATMWARPVAVVP